MVQRTKVTTKQSVSVPVQQKIKVEAMTPPSDVEQNGGKLQWRKVGRGKLILASGVRIDQPNQIFWARPDEISPAFRDTVKLAHNDAPVVEPPLVVEEPKYTVKETPPDSGQYEILDGRGKIVNEAPLTADQAEEMVKKLQGE
jgi:hypothetical protein